MPDKLKEMDVINHVCDDLKLRGYVIIHKVLKTTDHGVDIKARTPDGRYELWVEAKGQTSSKRSSSRYTEGFDKNQEADHLGKAILKCLEYISENAGKSILTGIAVPSDEYYNEIISKILPSLERLEIAVFLDAFGKVKALGLRK